MRPDGGMSWISKPWESSVSDNQMIEDDDMLEYVDYGDTFLGDRGYTCKHLFAERGAHLLTPPWKPRDGSPMSEEDIELGRRKLMRFILDLILNKEKSKLNGIISYNLCIIAGLP